MAFETLLATFILAGIAGTLVSGLVVLAKAENWDWRKYLFSLGMAVIAALVYIEGFGQNLTEETLIPIFIGIIGASFIGNELSSIANRLKNNEDEYE